MSGRTMQVRVRWAALLGIAGAAGGAFAGWSSTAPLFRAEAIVYLMPHPQDAAVSDAPGVFEGLIALKIQMMESPRAAKQAMETQPWQRTGEGSSAEATRRFLEHRRLVHRPGTLHTQVQFVDASPDVALAGVQALTETFVSMSGHPAAEERGGSDAWMKLSVARLEVLTAGRRDVQERLDALAAPFGDEDGLAMRHHAAIQQLLAVEEELAKLDRSGGQIGLRPLSPMTAGAIALESPTVADAQLKLELLEADERRLMGTVGEKNDELSALRGQIDARRKWVTQFVESWNRRRQEEWDRKTQMTALPGSTSIGWEQRESALLKRLEALRAENQRLGQVRVEVGRLKAENEDLGRKIEQTRSSSSGLTAPGLRTDVVRVADEGSLPTSPFEDRRPQLAALGAGLCGLLGALGALLLRPRDRTNA